MIGIIRGDIKPENVLIFQDQAGQYIAKVIDFGYSSRFANEDEDILLPCSWPWNAPESYSRCKPTQARKMDVFSFGMLCLWVIFENYLSGTVPFPEEARWAEQYFENAENESRSKSLLDELKRSDKLSSLSRQLITAAPDLEENQKITLLQFFDACLVHNPELREANLK